MLASQTHPGGRWWTLETRHFRVHVRPEQRELGVRAAGEAEAAYALLAGELPPPRGKVELVVTDHVDDANGLATVYPTPRIVVFAFPPAGDLQLGVYDRWLRLVITHELAHVFHFDLARGWWRLAQQVLGRAPTLFPNAYLPTWLTEGLAVYYESRLTAGGRLDGSFHRSVVAAAAGEGGGLPIDAAGLLSPRWPGGIRPYAFGASFLGAVAAERGDSVVRRLALETARRPIPYLQLNGALRRAAGIRFTAAWRGWQDSLVAAARGAEAPDAPAPLCCLRVAVPPRVSRDARRLLVAHSDGRDAARLVVLDRRTGEVRALSRLNGFGGVAWDAPGIAGESGAIVAQFEFTDPYTVRSDLWRVGADGTERRLTHGARLSQPDVDSHGVVYAVRAHPGGNELVRWDSSGARTIAPGARGIEWAHPRVSADGSAVAVVLVREGRHYLVLLGPAGGQPRAVIRDPGVVRTPAFSPDGRWLFWTSDRSGGLSQVYAAAPGADSAVVWRVTDAPYGAYAPAAADDSLYYLGYRADGFRLQALAMDTTRWARWEEPEPRAAADAGTGEPAPPAILAEHGYRPFATLLPRFWLPVWESASGSNWLGGLTAGSDALSRHRYVADFSIGTGDAAGTWQGHLSYQYAGYTPALLDFEYARDQLPFSTGKAADPVGCCRTDQEVGLGVTVPRRRWRTAVAARLGAEYQRFDAVERLGAVLTVAASHLVQPAFAISPQDGWRSATTLRRRWRRDRPLGYTEATFRAAGYRSFRSPGFARQVLAGRAAFGLLSGSEPVEFLIGGVSGGVFEVLPGLSLGTGSRTFPVRGYQPGAARGRRAAALAIEHRFPLALVGRGVGLFPVMLDRVSIAVFGDVGAGWSRGNCPADAGGRTCVQVLASLGGEAVADLGVAYDLPLRLRLGAARLLDRRAFGGYVAVGPAL